MRGLSLVIAGGLLLGASCTGEPEDDGAEDSFLADGKTDYVGVEEGSAEACGVLRLVNEASRETLDEDARLSSSAARNIVAYRVGPDGEAGTDDDEHYGSLAELDAVRYVGPATFGHLVDYAAAEGFTCQDTTLQVLAFSDFHGQLDSTSVQGVGAVGGAAVLATYFKTDRRANPETLALAAGDSFGASPPLSSFFGEESTVDVLGAMGLAADNPGNHGFDRGLDALSNLADRASYPTLAANLAGADTLACPSQEGGRCVRPYQIFAVAGLKVAVIGLVTPEAPTLVTPGAMGDLVVTDPIAAAQEARQAAAEEGAQVFIAIAHIGGAVSADGQVTGPLYDLANGIEGFDLVIGGHTHTELATEVGATTVVETKSGGVGYYRIQLRYDYTTREVTVARELVVPKADGVTPDAAVTALLDPYRTELSRQLDGPIGVATGLFERGSNVERLREMPIGDLLADALRQRYGTQLGFVNGGGIRAPLPSSYAPADTSLRRPATGYATGPSWDLVVGDVYAVLPFGNSVVIRTVTGAQLWQMCEHSVEALPNPAGWFGQISGFRFTFDSTRPIGSRVVAVTLEDGAPIAADGTSYSLATADFLAAGGDGYSMLAGGGGDPQELMAEVLLAHVRSLGTITPETFGRIVDVATP